MNQLNLLPRITIGIGLLEAIGGVYVIIGRVMTTARLGVQVRRVVERLPRRAPLLCHLEHVRRPLVTFHRFLDLGRAPARFNIALSHNVKPNDTAVDRKLGDTSDSPATILQTENLNYARRTAVPSVEVA